MMPKSNHNRLNDNGFSLLEIVLTIIIIGICVSALVESFLVGAGQSLKVANQEVAANIAKQTMAQVYYCMYGGGNCNNSTPPPLSAAWSQSSSSALNAYLGGLDPYTSAAPYVNSGTGYDFYSNIAASFISGTSGSGTWSYNPPPSANPTSFIMVTVTTSWYNATGGSSISNSNPSVVLSAVLANY